MATTSYLHSNAFNFLSFVAGGVDPRTGQYTLAIELPELPANQLNGPDLPLRLGFNPLNIQDSGFGIGWSLNLTQFVPSSGMLALHTGEQFRVSDNGPGHAAVIPERKIESFKFENVSDEQTLCYRIAHKSGLVELLQPQAPDYKVALPVRVLAPSGHGIRLTYEVVKGVACLATMVEESAPARTLLHIDYSSNARALIHLNPNSAASASYSLERDGDALSAVILPSQDRARWTFTYRPIGALRCLQTVETPVGAVERIEYEEQGHKLPGSQGRSVPYVKRHRLEPGQGMPVQDTRYSFSSNNFLGYGTGISWQDNGLDNLYAFTGTSYVYSSTETQYRDEQPARTIERSFNRFHLTTSEVTREDGCILSNTTTYHEVPNLAFKDQPEHFQLPQLANTAWTQSGTGLRRDEQVSTDYDRHGNLLVQVEPSGVKEVLSYYPKESSEGCPADPEGFVRQLKSRSLVPSSEGEGGTEALRTDYTYEALPGLDGGRGTLLLSSQSLIRVSDDLCLTHIQTQYANEVSDPLRYGRSLSEARTIGGLRTLSEYAYDLVQVEGRTAVETRMTVSGFDHDTAQADGTQRHAQKTTTLQACVLTGLPLLNHDDNEVQIAYAYDELRRVIRETVSPNDERYTATRHYSYHLSTDGSQAVQVEQDVKGVTSWTYVDGLNRVVRRTRQDPDYGLTAQARQAQRLVYTAAYDALGRLTEETEHDWLALSELPLRRAFEYDGWGQQYCEIGADGVRSYTQNDPIGTVDSNGPILTQWRSSADGQLRTGKTVTWLNRFDKPSQVERFSWDDNVPRISLHQYFYDGFGRTAREVDGRGAQTSFTYDEFDRLSDHTLADAAVVHRDYAPHSPDDLPVLIKVVDKGVHSVLGEQGFDGLDRMVTSITGGRERTYLYAQGQRQPQQVITPRGNTIKYVYLPQLGEEPLQRALIDSGVEAEYEYDPQNARLLRCVEQDEVLEREYFSTGQLRKEMRGQGDTDYTMHYLHSLQGRLLSYTDVLGSTQSYHYNPLGQLVQTALGTVASTFEYDELGRTRRIFTETCDGDGSRRSLETTLEYDEFERETLRRFDFTDCVQTLSQTYDAVDAMETKTLCEGDRLLRKETYSYDKRGRLVDYRCEGEDDYRPVDPFGKSIQGQRFTLDALDNITRVRTLFDGGTVDARYQFENADDPAQLTSIIINGLEAQPRVVALEYDADGNMTCDDQARVLEYDALGRLVRVDDSSEARGATYGYDPLDRLATQVGLDLSSDMHSRSVNP
ncbi:RHS repeat protein [Pseudomonas cremoricolorata]|uniref:RHS repeat protein n=1 Tax=Pseudomonas cremoricolorata TaxID=157783 RepID=UPI00041C7BFA|nr:RHS repeat protein [Pseudomonas cremoricolorata]